ncbi:hypothetical protein [Novosphingobium sp.]|nr:hypothetical protein [Novosphingobium sp.]MDP3906055.1 hypothetical protein [Novosphingobium sp.]
MTIGTIIVALIAIVIAWKVLTGVIKLGVIALIVVAVLYFLSQGAI